MQWGWTQPGTGWRSSCTVPPFLLFNRVKASAVRPWKTDVGMFWQKIYPPWKPKQDYAAGSLTQCWPVLTLLSPASWVFPFHKGTLKNVVMHFSRWKIGHANLFTWGPVAMFTWKHVMPGSAPAATAIYCHNRHSAVQMQKVNRQP